MWDGEYPWDVRVEKVSQCLTNAGFLVSVVARNRRAEPSLELLEEAAVHRLRPLRGLPKAVSDASMFPAFFNPRWYRAIRDVCELPHTRLILCRDLPLAIPAIVVGRRFRLPVVLDMAENYPGMLEERRATGRWTLTDRIVRSPHAAANVEKWVLRHVDAVLTVVEESGQRIREHGVDAERITVVRNTPPLSRLLHPIVEHNTNSPLRLVYLGLVEEQRGVGVLLDAVRMLTVRGAKVEVNIVGGGKDMTTCMRYARQIQLSTETVKFTGHLPNETALEHLRTAHVGVSPLWRGAHIDTTVPNKLFDYMAAGLPVVTSDSPPSARTVRSAECGLVFRDRDAESLASVLDQLRDCSARQRLGANARIAIRDKYNWERDCRRLVAVVGRLIKDSRTTRWRPVTC